MGYKSMKKMTKNHILRLTDQKENDFNALRDIILMDNIDHVIEILYLSYDIYKIKHSTGACDIDECIEKAIKEHKEKSKINTDDEEI